MREILFRGKQIDNGEWVEGSYIRRNRQFNDVTYHIGPLESEEDPPYAFILVEVDPATVGQYTGLKDKNGKKIFEGDIAICDWHWTPSTEIEWPDDIYEFIEFAMEDSVTILGNIHDSPELLKENDDT